METVEDIVKETREHHILTTAPCACWVMRKEELIELCDRLDAAYKRDLQAMVDAGEIDMRTAMGEVERLRAENERLMSAVVRVHGCLDATCGSMGVCRTCEFMRIGGAE